MNDPNRPSRFLHVLETNTRSQKKIAEFVKSYYDAVPKLDLASGDMFGNSTPSKPGLLMTQKKESPTNHSQSKTYSPDPLVRLGQKADRNPLIMKALQEAAKKISK